MENPENDGAVFRPSHNPWKSKMPIPHSHRRDEDEQNMKSSRKGAVRAARLTATLQAHSWIGKD
ncbi:MAG: hypothetical protein ACLPM3_01045, partial [Terracidiphilus sp.]